MARNSIAANLLMFILLGGGLWSAVAIQKEVFPQYELDFVEVSVEYPGAAPAEVEQGILRSIEGAVRSVEGIIRNSSQDVAAGSVQTSAGEILLRVKARKQRAEEFAAMGIVTGRDGPAVTLGDIATIRDGFEEVGFHSQFSQTPSVELDIYRTGSQSPTDVAEAVAEVLQGFESGLPPGVKWRIDRNNAEEFRRRLNLVLKNAAIAVGIVLLILALFLEIRLAFWVMMGMVVSFVGGLLLMPIADVSVNMISLFGFLVVLGIVVDDAIVVGENVYEKRQESDDDEVAAIEGTREVAGPVVFSILTNIVAFVPLMFIPTGIQPDIQPLRRDCFPPCPPRVLTFSLHHGLRGVGVIPCHIRLCHQRSHGHDPDARSFRRRNRSGRADARRDHARSSGRNRRNCDAGQPEDV
jgi:multidrug efflux pump subunit AcrB